MVDENQITIDIDDLNFMTMIHKASDDWGVGFDYAIDPIHMSRGSYGAVYRLSNSGDPPKVMKRITLYTDTTSPEKKTASIAGFIAEARIQRTLSTMDPPVCPTLYAWGFPTYHYSNGSQRKRDDVGILVMDRAVGTAEEYLQIQYAALTRAPPEGRPSALENLETAVLSYYAQVATILKELEVYEFNHRDLKADNVLYTLDEEGKPIYLLSDFGFACMKIDGREVSGRFAAVKVPGACFRKSRDLSQMVFQSRKFILEQSPLDRFVRSVLVVPTGAGEQCYLPDCPGFPQHWGETYEYFNTPGIENPNTTPDGLLAAIESYRADPDKYLAEHPVPSGEPAREVFYSSSGRLLDPQKSYDAALIEDQQKAKAEALGAGAGAGRTRTRRRKVRSRRRKLRRS